MFFKREQTVNTTQSMVPTGQDPLAERIEPGADMTDVNGSPSAMDEDGEQDTDESPLILGMVVCHTSTITDVMVTIPGPTGPTSKRMVATGGVTAKKLAAMLAGVASW